MCKNVKWPGSLAVDPQMLYLFSADGLLHLTGKEATKYTTGQDIDDDDDCPVDRLYEQDKVLSR